MTDLSQYKTFMTLGEARSVAEHLGNLRNMLSAKHVTVADHVIYDENGEAIGEVTFNEGANAYVLSYDYIHANHGTVEE